MKGIYLTQEGKQEIEDKIIYLQELEENEFIDEFFINECLSQIRVYKEILASATILLVEKSWDDCLSNTERDDCVHSNKINYPNGVIIQPKS